MKLLLCIAAFLQMGHFVISKLFMRTIVEATYLQNGLFQKGAYCICIMHLLCFLTYDSRLSPEIIFAEEPEIVLLFEKAS